MATKEAPPCPHHLLSCLFYDCTQNCILQNIVSQALWRYCGWSLTHASSPRDIYLQTGYICSTLVKLLSLMHSASSVELCMRRVVALRRSTGLQLLIKVFHSADPNLVSCFSVFERISMSLGHYFWPRGIAVPPWAISNLN